MQRQAVSGRGECHDLSLRTATSETCTLRSPLEEVQLSQEVLGIPSTHWRLGSFWATVNGLATCHLCSLNER
jgi:hypothetical protein